MKIAIDSIIYRIDGSLIPVTHRPVGPLWTARIVDFRGEVFSGKASTFAAAAKHAAQQAYDHYGSKRFGRWLHEMHKHTLTEWSVDEQHHNNNPEAVDG